MESRCRNGSAGRTTPQKRKKSNQQNQPQLLEKEQTISYSTTLFNKRLTRSRDNKTNVNKLSSSQQLLPRLSPLDASSISTTASDEIFISVDFLFAIAVIGAFLAGQEETPTENLDNVNIKIERLEVA